MWQVSRRDLLAGRLMWAEPWRGTSPVQFAYAASGGLRRWRRYGEASLATFDWNRLPEPQARQLQAYAAGLAEHLAEGWGLVLSGGVGCGKTHLAVGLGVLALGLGYSAYATTLDELLRGLRSSYQSRKPGKEARLLARVAEVDLLILDDLGLERPTPWARERLAQVIQQRYNRGRALLVTTGLGLDELERVWGVEVVSRLYGSCRIVGLEGVPDYRRLQRSVGTSMVAG